MDANISNSLPEITGVTRDLGARREINEHNIDNDAAEHRSESAYIGLRLPKRPRRPHKHHHHKNHHHSTKSNNQNSELTPVFTAPGSLTPSEQIQSLLSDDADGQTTHDVFCEMDVLFKAGEIYQWRETARWVKYEEDVEECGMRWSKPHVASLSLHSLFELRSSLTSGACMLNMNAHTMGQVADLLLDNLVSQKLLEESLRDAVRAALIAQHCFQHQKLNRKNSTVDGGMKRSLSGIGRSFSKQSKGQSSHPNHESMMNGNISESPSTTKLNTYFMKKIPDGAEAANILVGELDCLKYQVCAMIRLVEGRNIGDITEVPIPTRFLFLLLGPPGSQNKNTEIGRSMSTIMVDEVFREVAYKARNRQDILAGVDEFLDQVTALPPGEWDPKIRIEPPSSVPSQTPRKIKKQEEEEEEEEESHCDPTLQRSGRLFGGLIADIRRKLPWYGSDFTDCLHIQCVASVIFLFLATLTPNVTFGGLLGQATDQYMGTMECILTASIVGILFALFAGQPLNILGSTGPMLVLEMILYTFCDSMGFDFLPLRAWIGLWTAFLLLLIVAFDLSALVRYITRFTEESFASLIAIIFIAEAFKKLFGILKECPINTDPYKVLDYTCHCMAPNESVIHPNQTLFEVNENATSLVGTAFSYLVGFNITDPTDKYSTLDLQNMDPMSVNWSSVNVTDCDALGGVPMTSGCDTPHYVPDAFFLSVLLFLGTFTLAYMLKEVKTSSFFPTYVRQTMSDFAVLIAIVAMVLADILIGIQTPKLKVPTEFKPTSDVRGWFINPFSDKNPTWVIFASVVPALLAVILIFLDQQITAVIVNRKENKLKKGNGYHLDMFVVAICIAICSLLGLPWYVAATVSALAHVMSLKKESECTAPGERPTFLGVREQRVTALLVGILSGLSVFITPILNYIPMAVLYGVFLYMGVAALKGMQFIDRLMLFFKPAKYQPDLAYLRHVSIKRVHLFTLIQIVCLGVLWVIKAIKSISILFPIMVLGTCFCRKAMDWIFTQRELKWLDDIMPEAAKKAKEDEKKKLAEMEEEEDDALLGGREHYDKLMEVKVDGKPYQRIPRNDTDTDRVNISEEMARTGIWLQLSRDSKANIRDAENGGHTGAKPPKKKRSKSKKKEKENQDNHRKEEEKATNFYLGDEEDHKV